MQTTEDVTAVIVNFRTLDETRTCLRTHARVIFNETNVFHGPALDQGMREADTGLVFLLDSDCEILHGGFLEPLVQAFTDDPVLYAIGKRGYANRWGYGPISDREQWTYYVHPFAAVVDRTKYFTLPPFVHHGAPLYRNMWGATRAGYHLRHVTIEDHVVHRHRTTAQVHGYAYDRRLRFQARINALDHRIRRTVARITGRELKPPELPPARTGEGPELRDYELERARAAGDRPSD